MTTNDLMGQQLLEACQRLRRGGGFLSRLQDGQVQHYLRVLGLALTALLLLLTWGCGK